MVEQHIRLRAAEPGGTPRTWDADRGARVGRSDAAQIFLNHPSISRQHAEIEPTARGWVVRDLGSRNGTFVNGVRVGRVGQPLRERDLLQCGSVVLVVESLTDPAGDGPEDYLGPLKVKATARQSIEQAADVLARSVTRSTRPGEQLLSLLRAGQALDGPDSLDDLLRRTLRDAVGHLEARQGAIALLDPHSPGLTVRAVHPSTASGLAGHPFSHTLARRCLQAGQSLLCSDVLGDAELRSAPSVLGGQPGSVLCALLRSPRKALGVLQLDRAVAAEPFSLDELNRIDALAVHLSSAIDNANRMQEMQRNMFIQTIIAFSQVIELRDEYTAGHTQRVTDYSLLLAEELDLSEPDRYRLRVGSPLHDIGKVGIDDNVLRKPDRLTAAEFDHMKTHTVKGATILGTFSGLEDIIPIVRSHHERWDGAGYPDRLGGEAIPRLARLVAVADTFDAMTSDRPYRRGMSMDRAFEQIRAGAGTQFDPTCAAAFLRLRRRVEDLHRQYGGSMVNTHGREQLVGLVPLGV